MIASLIHRRSPLILHMAWAIVLLAVVFGLPGCDGLTGTYEAEGGNKIEFMGDNAYVSIYPAPTVQAQYELEDDKVIITVSGEPMVLTRTGDKLEGGPFGMTFVKK